MVTFHPGTNLNDMDFEELSTELAAEQAARLASSGDDPYEAAGIKPGDFLLAGSVDEQLANDDKVALMETISRLTGTPTTPESALETPVSPPEEPIEPIYPDN